MKDGYLDRNKYNKLILQRIQEAMSSEQGKDLRFLQILSNLNIIPKDFRSQVFNTESEATFNHMKTVKEMY